jgi:hypothetical protein
LIDAALARIDVKSTKRASRAMANNVSERTEPRQGAKSRRATRETPDATTTIVDAAAATATVATTPVALTHLGFVNDATTSGVKYVSEHALTSKVIGAYAGARDATALKVRD